ncbi:MAG: class I SAM-dependent methyltransferase [Solirubrobacteraceae bacterium]
MSRKIAARRPTSVEPASNVEWRRWGDEDPFFGVASWANREREGTNPWTAADFYALGARDWADFRKRWWSYGVERDQCLELGCGVGRLTKHIAADFREVIGVDVSEGMLRAADEHLAEPGIDLRLGNGIVLPAEDACADGVFSSHVFQHFDSYGVARANLVEIARVLKPCGSAMVHLPLHAFPPGLEALEHLVTAKRQLSTMRAAIKRRTGKPLMRGLVYPMNWLQSTLAAIGYRDVEISIFSTSANDDPHPFVLMRRA